MASACVCPGEVGPYPGEINPLHALRAPAAGQVQEPAWASGLTPPGMGVSSPAGLLVGEGCGE